MNAPMLAACIAFGWLAGAVIVGLIAGHIIAWGSRDRASARQVVFDVFDNRRVG